jgi:hypothetical protein
MFNKFSFLLLALTILLFVSCSKDSTSLGEDKRGQVTDIDGNVYETLKIGDQWWMIENLKVTRYQNGDTMPNVTDIIGWITIDSSAYCDYDNDIGNAAIYGHLYNWNAINDSRKIAPSGWRVPSREDLEVFLDQVQWDASKFYPVFGGYREPDGSFKKIGELGCFWSSSEFNADHAWYLWVKDGLNYFADFKSFGYSVRCIKN